MSTRSIIAIPTDTDWKGRYVHWDGYPTNMVPELSAIIKRDGYETAIKTLTEDHKSWSGIYAHELPETNGGVPVPGYGIAHSDIPEDEDPWLHPGEDDWTEWVYVLLPWGIVVYKRGSSVNPDRYAGFYDWNEPQLSDDINETVTRTLV